MSHLDEKVLIVTCINGPLKSHDSLTVFFIHGQECVTLLIIHQWHELSFTMTVLSNKSKIIQQEETLLFDSLDC